MQIIERSQVEIGKRFASIDSETGAAQGATVIRTKTTDDGRLEVLARYDDGDEVWLPTYYTSTRPIA